MDEKYSNLRKGFQWSAWEVILITLYTHYPLWSLVRLPYYNLTIPVEIAHYCPPHEDGSTGVFVGLGLEIVTSAQYFLNFM